MAFPQATRGKRRFKPAGRVKINTKSAFAQGLIGMWPLNEATGFEELTGNWSLSSIVNTVITNQRAVQTVNNSSMVIWNYDRPDLWTGDLTIAYLVHPYSVVKYNVNLNLWNTLNIYSGSAGQGFFEIAGGTSRNVIGTYAANKTYDVVYSYNGTSRQDIMVRNGQLMLDGINTKTGPAAPPTMNIGLNSQPSQQEWGYVALWNRAMDLQQMYELNLEGIWGEVVTEVSNSSFWPGLSSGGGSLFPSFSLMRRRRF